MRVSFQVASLITLLVANSQSTPVNNGHPAEGRLSKNLFGRSPDSWTDTVSSKVHSGFSAIETVFAGLKSKIMKREVGSHPGAFPDFPGAHSPFNTDPTESTTSQSPFAGSMPKFGGAPALSSLPLGDSSPSSPFGGFPGSKFTPVGSSMPKMPTMPKMPSIPEMPSTPEMPSFSKMPSIPEMPSFAKVPSMAEMPSFSKMPSFESMPGFPGMS